MFISSASSPYLVSISWDGEVNTNKSWKFDDIVQTDRRIKGNLAKFMNRNTLFFN